MMLRQSYQIPAVDAICENLTEHQSTLLALATGLGKTLCAAEVIKRFHERTGKLSLFLADRDHLIWQSKAAIEEHTGLTCAVEMNRHAAELSLFSKDKVIVSTVQTQISGKLKKRMHRFRPEDFCLVIIDECHQSAAPTYKLIWEHYRQNPNIKLLGITATPLRSDGKALIFESTAYKYPIRAGVKDGWLVDVAQQFVKVESLDWSECRVGRNGELRDQDVAKVVEKTENILGIVHPSLEAIFGLEPETLTSKPIAEWTDFLKSTGRTPRRTIIFTATVKQAEEFCYILNTAFPGLAEWICGETTDDKRTNLLNRFITGRTAVVCNVGVLCQGYDNPFVELIIMARAIRSLSLYTQQLGRGTRTLPGLVDDPALTTPELRRAAIRNSAKPIVRIVDFKGNSGRHKLVNSMHVLAGDVMSDEAIERAVNDAVEHGRPKLAMPALNNAQRKLHQEELQRKAEIEAARLRKLRAPKARYRVRDVDPFGNEGFRSANGNVKAKKDIPDFVTKKLRKHNFREPANYKQAMVLYKVAKDRERKMPISDSNKQKLERLGYECEGWTEARANRAWAEWISNGKQKPLVSKV